MGSVGGRGTMGWSLSQGRLESGGQRGSETAYSGKPHHPSPRQDPHSVSPSLRYIHIPTCIPAVCPVCRCVLKQLHIQEHRLSFSKLFLTVQLCRVHPQIVNIHNYYGGLQSMGEPKCSWCIEHTHNSIIPCMLLQVSKLLSAISDQSICHHYSQEKIA